jgi:hypothetical protein
MSEFNYKDYIANNPLLSEVKLTEEEEDLMKDSLGNVLAIGDIIKGENNVRYQIRYSPLRGMIVLQPSVEVDGDEFYADGKEITNVGDKEKFVDIVTKSTRIKRNIDVEDSKAFINEEESFLDAKSPSEIRGMIKTLRNASRIIQSLKFYGTEKQQVQADKLYGTGGLGRLITLMNLELENKK